MVKSLKISNFIVYQAIKMYMNISDSLDQYADICRDAIKKSSAKLNKRFENLLVEILLLYMIIPRKINFTQMERYGSHCEQTYRRNFNRKKSECINWLSFNLSLAKRSLDMDGLLAVAIDPCYISKAGRKTAHIGTFWSGCAGSMKHGLEIMGLGLVDVKHVYDAACPSDSWHVRTQAEEQDFGTALHRSNQTLQQGTRQSD